MPSISQASVDFISQNELAADPDLHGSMMISIVAGTDKTTVSVATGDNNYYPLYMSIGNLHNGARRAHRHGVVLVGFLAIPKGDALLILIQNLYLYWFR
jgi:hypothetical protein